MEEPFFLYDELAEERSKIIKWLIKEVDKKPFKSYKEAKFLDSFVKALVMASGNTNRYEIIQRQIDRTPSISMESHPRIMEERVFNIPQQSIPTLPKYQPKQFPTQIQNNVIKKEPIQYKQPIQKLSDISVIPPMIYKPKITNKFLDEAPEPSKPIIMQSRITSFIGPGKDSINSDTVIKVEQYYLDDNSRRILEKLELSIDSQEKFNDFERVFQKTLNSSNLKEKDVEKDKIKKIVYSNIIGLGKIEILLKDPNIKGIYCEGLHIPLIVDHVQLGNVRTDLVFNDSSELKRLIKNMANIGRVALDENNLSASGSFANGYKFKVDLGTQLSNPRFYISK